MSLEKLLDKYDEGINSRSLRILKGIGIVLAFIGWVCIFWMIPQDLIRTWMGDSPYANWATVFCILILFYYGSESFSLTFAGGFFLLGCLLAVEFVYATEIIPFQIFWVSLLAIGYLLLLIVRLARGTLKFFYRDIIFLPVMPVWIFRFLYRFLGVSL